MAVVFLTGFETRDYKEMSSTSGSPTIETTVVRSGDASSRADALTDRIVKDVGATMASFSFSFGLRFTAAPAIARAMIFVTNSAVTTRLTLQLDTDRTLKLNVPSGGSGTAVLAVDTYYQIEVVVDGAGNTVKVYVDGSATPDIDYSGALGGDDSQVFYLDGVVDGGDFTYYDDIRIDDVATQIGLHKVVRLEPNANGSDAWDTGGYADVDDWATGADDGTSTEALCTASPSAATDNVTSTASAGIGSSDTINAIAAKGVLARGTGGAVDHYLRITSDTPANDDSADLALTGSYLLYEFMCTLTMPTPTELDSWEVGGTTAGAQNLEATATALMVDYTEAAPSGTVVAPSAVSSVVTAVIGTILLGALTLLPAIGSAVAISVNPTVVKGSLSLTPSPGSAVVTSVDPAVATGGGGISVAPSASSVVVATIDPAIVKGSLSITPSPGTVVATSIDPTVIQDSLSMTPAFGTVVAVGVDPTVIQGSLSIPPSSNTVVVISINPTVIQDSLSITPSPDSVVAVAIGPTVIQDSLSIVPASGTVVAISIAPTVIQGSLSILLSPITVVVVSVNPTVIEGGGGISVTPAPGTAVAVSVDPTVIEGSLSLSATPSSVVVTAVAPVVVEAAAVQSKVAGLEAEYRMESEVTFITPDSSGNGNDATASENATLEDGMVGLGYTLSGDPSVNLILPAVMSIGAGGSWALEIVFKTLGGTNKGIIGNLVAGGGQGYSIQLTSGVLWAQSLDSNSVNESRLIIAGAMTDNVRHHVVYTRDGANNLIYAHFDGVQMWAIADNRTGHFTATGGNIHYIGGQAAGNFFPGGVDEGRFWSIFLPSARVKQLQQGYLYGGM